MEFAGQKTHIGNYLSLLTDNFWTVSRMGDVKLTLKKLYRI
jgi:hypothetical protein